MVQQEKLEYEENRVETPKKLEQNGVKMMEFNEIRGGGSCKTPHFSADFFQIDVPPCLHYSLKQPV